MRVTDEAVLNMFPDDEPVCRRIRVAQPRVAFQGLPARICRLGYAGMGSGVARHADAGYAEALATATTGGIRLPMLEQTPHGRS